MDAANIILGQQQLRAGNVRAAEKLAIRALSENPKNEAALDLRFDCFIFDGDYQSAKKLAEEWMDLDSANIKAYECLFQAELYLKNKKACENLLGNIKASFPTKTLSIKIREALYDLVFLKGKKARVIFKELSEEYPDIGVFLKLQADTAFKRDQLFTAHRLYREAIQMDPTCAETWYMYSINSFHTMRYGEARKAARQALQLDPKREKIKAIIMLSWIVYIPIFYFASFLGTTYFYISEFFGKLTGTIAAGLAGYFIFGKMMVKGLRWLSSEGIHINPWLVIGGILLWAAISQGTFYWMGNQKKKIKNIKLSNY